jgi:hypothetical protein
VPQLGVAVTSPGQAAEQVRCAHLEQHQVARATARRAGHRISANDVSI